jgi:hypothetical protein
MLYDYQHSRSSLGVSGEEWRPMPATIDSSARDLIEQHGMGAVYAAVEHLNQSIDEGDRIGRDFWAQVVHAIHEYQRSVSPLRADVR